MVNGAPHLTVLLIIHGAPQNLVSLLGTIQNMNTLLVLMATTATSGGKGVNPTVNGTPMLQLAPRGLITVAKPPGSSGIILTAAELSSTRSNTSHAQLMSLVPLATMHALLDGRLPKILSA